MNSKVYGIDFGTYAIKIYKKNTGICYHQASIIASRNKGTTVIAIGDEAYEMSGKQPDYISVEFPIQNGVVANYDTMLSLLNCIAMDLNRVGNKVKNASFLIAVPSEVTDVEKKTFYDIIDSSIMRPRSIKIVEKPIADALGAGIDIQNSNGSLILDIGAATTEISVLSQGGIVLNRLFPCGGYQFDEAIINIIRRKHNLLIGPRTAAEAKIKLVDFTSSGEETGFVYGRDIVNGLPSEREVTCELLNNAVEEPLGRILEEMKSLLERIPPEISADVYRNGIVITGASSGLKGLSAWISQRTGLFVKIAQNGATSVAEGLGKIIENSDFRDYAKSLKQTYYEND